MKDLLADSDSVCEALAKLATDAYLTFPGSHTINPQYPAVDTFVFEFNAARIRYPERMRKIETVFDEESLQNRMNHLHCVRVTNRDDSARYLREFGEALFAFHARIFASAKKTYAEATAI